MFQAHMLDRICGPRTPGAGLHSLSIELLGDNAIDESECREFASTLNRCDRSAIVIGRAWTVRSQFIDGSSFPLHTDLSETLRSVDRTNRHGLDNKTQHRFAICRCRRRGAPDRWEIPS